VTLFSRALAITDRNWLALNNLGIFYGDHGQYPKAIGYFQETLRIRPDFPTAWNNMGVSYAILGQYQQAIGCFQEALRIKPDYAPARKNLFKANSELGKSR
jgi:tetratricopeptide (TPR) repeat protein